MSDQYSKFLKYMASIRLYDGKFNFFSSYSINSLVIALKSEIRIKNTYDEKGQIDKDLEKIDELNNLINKAKVPNEKKKLISKMEQLLKKYEAETTKDLKKLKEKRKSIGKKENSAFMKFANGILRELSYYKSRTLKDDLTDEVFIYECRKLGSNISKHLGDYRNTTKKYEKRKIFSDKVEGRALIAHKDDGLEPYMNESFGALNTSSFTINESYELKKGKVAQIT